MSVATKPKFSGHETFPMRYGWLKKSYDAVRACEGEAGAKQSVFSADDAIATLGVGRNMVRSMRHWSLAAGVLKSLRRPSGTVNTTWLGRSLLDDNGWDPYQEVPGSLWIAHWQFASAPETTFTWYWMFNHWPRPTFTRDEVVEHIRRYCTSIGQKPPAQTTLRRDVECFIQTYAPASGSGAREDDLACPLAELALISGTGPRGECRMIRGPKPTLSVHVLAYALVRFWIRHHASERTMSFESLMHEPGSPGRVFGLDEESLMDLVAGIDDCCDGKLAWSETAGLRQLIAHTDPAAIDPLSLLAAEFKAHQSVMVAA